MRSVIREGQCMNDIIIYRPYRSLGWFLFFTVPAGILTLGAAGYCLQYGGLIFIIFVIVGIAYIWVNKVLYDAWNIAVVFEQDGLRIVGGRFKDYQHILWKEVPYAYYVRNYKGHLFLELSPKALNPKEAKRIANRNSHLNKICKDSVVVIYIDNLQNTSHILELIVNYVVHVTHDNNT